MASYESDNINGVARELTFNVAKEILGTIRQKMQESDKIYTGEAHDSWEIERTKRDAILINKTAAMWHVEFGRRPNQRAPPRDIIEDWLIGKLHMSKPKAKRLAYIVAKRIGIEGIRPTYIIRDTIGDYYART